MKYYCFNRQELLQKAKEKYETGGKKQLLNIIKTIMRAQNKKQIVSIRIWRKEEKKEKKTIFQEQVSKNEREIKLNYKHEPLLVQ